MGRANDRDAEPRSSRETMLNVLLAATFALSLASSSLQLVLAHAGSLLPTPTLLEWLTTLVAFFALWFAWHGYEGWRRRVLATSGSVVVASTLLSLAQAAVAPAFITSLVAFLLLAVGDVAERARQT